MIEKNDLMKPARVGEIVEGKIIGKGRSAVFLDLGSIGTGIIFGKEFYQAKEKLKDLKMGDKTFVKIIDLENEEGYIELSISGASRELAFEVLKEKKEKGESILVKILGANKGGLISEVSGIPSFLPVSQLSSNHYPKVEGGDKTKILRELQKFIGKTLEVKILNLDPKNEQIILSEKAKVFDEKREILKNYQVGDIVEGEITGITDFGVFLRFDKEESRPEPVEGLIHISELDWKIIKDPSEVVKVGQIVKAKIIEISGDKVWLSLKALKKQEKSASIE